jgi:hypothetical protein
MNNQNLIPPKPGEIRNPKGKPKGTKNRSTILKKWLKVRVIIKDKSNPSLKDVKGTVEDQINLALINKAMKGDVQAIKEINDTIYGKISEKTELTGPGGKDLIPAIVFKNFTDESE